MISSITHDDLREGEEWCRVSFEKSLDATFITDPADGRILAANPCACRMFGYTAEELLNLSYTLLLDEAGHGTPEFLEERNLRGNALGELVHIRKDGAKFATEVSSSLFRDNRGRDLYITIVRDVTKRKQAEEALAKARRKLESNLRNVRMEEELRKAKESAEAAKQEVLNRAIELDAAINSITDGVMIFGPNKEMLLINSVAAYLLDYTGQEISLNELVRTQRLKTLDGKELPVEEHPLLKALQGQTTVSLPLWVHSVSRRKKKCISFSAAPIFVSTGKFLGAVATFSDITKQILLTEEIRKARDELELRVEQRTEELQKAYLDLKDYSTRLEFLNRELQEFAFVASHDLQEPLRKIQVLGDLVLLKCTLGIDAEGQDYLKRMQKSAARMSDLLQGLLDYSRVTAKKQSYISTNLDDIVRGVVNDFDLLIEKKEGVIETVDLPTIEADPTQMHQLFQNLIGNALKYSKEDEKPLIRIFGEIAEGIATISVEDNGIGFEEIYLDKIFRPLQRLHGRISRYEGIGMGLAICRKIVERHSGSITARSEPGRGTTFIVNLPVKQKNNLIPGSLTSFQR